MVSFEIYPEEKQRANKQTIWEYYFARKIAFLLAPIFIKLKISANFVSFLSFTAGIVGAIFIAFGNFWVIIAGTILMQAWLILDKTDGIVARTTKTTSKFGKFFEEINGSLIAVLFFASIGFAASHIPGVLFSSFVIHYSSFIILGVFTSLFVIFRHLISRHFEVVFGHDEMRGVVSGGGLWGDFYSATIKFSGIYSLAQPLFILAVIFNFIGLYTLIYFVIQGLLALASVSRLIVKSLRK